VEPAGPISQRRAETLKLAIVMVGLPARGKTYIARRIARYLSWLGRSARVFNVGNYRRERLGSRQDASFFDPGNAEGRRSRLTLALAALDDMCGWMAAGGEIGIYDATNSTRDRRETVARRLEAQGISVLYVESICHDQATIDANVRETKLRSPDYLGIEADVAVKDFLARIAHYEAAYEPVDDDRASYIKLIDVGRQVVCNKIEGYWSSRLVSLLVNLHTTPRTIWLTRHGESQFNVKGILGGDSSLSPRGEQYARAVSEFFKLRSPPKLKVWTSALQRSIQTARGFPQAVSWKSLDEIDAGICDGLTYAEIAQRMPGEFMARSADKFRYRYPRGESYQDVIQRLEPVMIELERQRVPVLVVAHQAVLRALYSYLVDLPPSECTRIPIPLHTVIELEPKAYGCEERRFALEPSEAGGDLRGSF
jgi:broad specificity phosphatase PhoE/predicted kinase